ncbi:methionine aminopeptidase [Candidatus Apopatosoma intestinale]|jgi:methionyl aminopeptidase|nr:type I methionyl aminopeptidase [Candidatus Apopatosoma intestinale]CCZ20236.1 methionine aminopeptidase [Candidatus Apopatosoma intestinale]
MILVKNSEQLAIMRKAGRITGEAILVARDHIREGVSTKELDIRIREYIEKCGAKPSFLGYGGFPGSACISLNDEVIHGIPSKDRILHEGDIVKIDVGACYKGFHGDSANTFGVGKISEEAEKLIAATRESFFRGAAQAKAGNRIGDIGSAVFEYANALGYGVVKRYVGHGVGMELHEDPEVPNFGTAGRGPRLMPGMTIAIEPMINAGTYLVKEMSDGWTVKTADGRLSAHYEHTVAITDGDAVLLTMVE